MNEIYLRNITDIKVILLKENKQTGIAIKLFTLSFDFTS